MSPTARASFYRASQRRVNYELISKLHRFIVFSLLLFSTVSAFGSSLEQLQATAREKKLAFTRPWQKLLHYKKTLFGRYRSQADGLKFFLSPEGKYDPESELMATLKGFFSTDVSGDDHPQCQFPARFQWLRQKLDLSPTVVPKNDCKKFWQFRDQVGARSVTLIFSSYYLNNPASAFGHTLLRLNRTESAFEGEKFELLDTGINYAAVVTTENALLYALYGLLGFFEGTFTRVPYYYKVREYNDFEARDLWEYDLNLSQSQVDLLVSHIWELGSTYFDYLYLSENCSYHILSALEAAIPERDLTDSLPYVVVPADTIRAVTSVQGLVTRVQFRPSLRLQFEHRLQPLSYVQLRALRAIASKRDLASMPVEFSPKARAEVLDAAIDYVDLHNFQEILHAKDSEASRWKQKLLVTRSQIHLASSPQRIEVPSQEMPHIGHEIRRVGAEFGINGSLGSFLGINYRLALHDLIDPKPGYPEVSQIEFLRTHLRYQWDQKAIWLDDFALFRVISLSPLTSFERQKSWKVRVGAKTVRDRNCENCLAPDFEVGVGIAHQPISDLTYFLTMDLSLELSPKFKSFIKPGLGPNLGIRLYLSSTFAMLILGSYRYQFFANYPHGYSVGLEGRWGVLKDLAVGFKAIQYPDSWESGIGLFYYF